MRKVTKMVGVMVMATSMFLGGFLSGSNIKESKNLHLKSGKVIGIEYSKNPKSNDFEESTDLLQFEIEGHIYEIKDYAEDMFVDDEVLVCIDTKGTESQKDDVIMMWRYYNNLD